MIRVSVVDVAAERGANGTSMRCRYDTPSARAIARSNRTETCGRSCSAELVDVDGTRRLAQRLRSL